jgi:hypothetical protein
LLLLAALAALPCPACIVSFDLIVSGWHLGLVFKPVSNDHGGWGLLFPPLGLLGAQPGAACGLWSGALIT